MAPKRVPTSAYYASYFGHETEHLAVLHEELRRGNVLEDGCEAVVGQGEEGERLIGRGGRT